MTSENSTETYMLPCVRQMTSASSMHEAPKARALGQPRGIEWGGMWEEVQEVGDTCLPMADSC